MYRDDAEDRLGLEQQQFYGSSPKKNKTKKALTFLALGHHIIGCTLPEH